MHLKQMFKKYNHYILSVEYRRRRRHIEFKFKKTKELQGHNSPHGLLHQ